MKLIQLTPGAGSMYCGNCLRDNALVGALHRLGHDACMVPLYLPLTLDDDDQSRDMPVFFGGLSVYFEQKFSWFRHLPRFVHRTLASRTLLRWIGSRAAATHPSQVGELTVSMLRGENGNQVAELDALCRWLKAERPDVLCFSNALLLGMHGEARRTTGAKTVCLLAGEDGFLDLLREPYRTESWNLVRKHAAGVDVLIAPSRYFAQYMENRLNLPKGRIQVVFNGLNLNGFGELTAQKDETILGCFARMSRDKGLDILVDSFLEVRRRGRFPDLKLAIGGGLTRWNEPFVDEQKRKISSSGLSNDVRFCPNVDRNEKISFLKSLSIFSVPSRLNEAFGLHVLEPLAAGVPILLPRRGAFPELIERTGGGLLFEPDDPVSLADRVEELLENDSRRRTLGETGQKGVFEHFNVDVMARRFMEVVSPTRERY